MNRRESLIGAGAALFAAAQTSALAQEVAYDHSHMHGTPLQGLLAATSDCVVKAQSCLAHCLILLADGDKAMAECAKAVNQTIAMCSAMQGLRRILCGLCQGMQGPRGLSSCRAGHRHSRGHQGLARAALQLAGNPR